MQGPIYRRGAELTALEGDLSRLMRSDDPGLGSLLTPLGAVVDGIADIGRLIDEIPEEMRQSRSARPLPAGTERAIADLKDVLGSAILSWLPPILSRVERRHAASRLAQTSSATTWPRWVCFTPTCPGPRSPARRDGPQHSARWEISLRLPARPTRGTLRSGQPSPVALSAAHR